MVKYKQKFLEMKKRYDKLVSHCINLSPEVRAWHVKENHPLLFYKDKFKVIEREKWYELYFLSQTGGSQE